MMITVINRVLSRDKEDLIVACKAQLHATESLITNIKIHVHVEVNSATDCLLALLTMPRGVRSLHASP